MDMESRASKKINTTSRLFLQNLDGSVERKESIVSQNLEANLLLNFSLKTRANDLAD